MQRFVDSRAVIESAIGEVNRKGRALLPFLLAPCIPAIVACSTAEVRADAGAQITPAVVAQSGLPPLLLRPLSKNAAVALNQRIPFSTEPQIPAVAFVRGKDELAGGRALECLTSAVYYEAASESEAGQQAVAQVILNRVRHPAFPASVCGVIFQGSTLRTGCQFSFTCDGSLLRVPSRKEWDRARGVAASALAGAVYAPVGLATHYHADYVVPYWAPSLAKATQVGAHIFYRWAGTWGRPPSFTQRYGASESNPFALRNVALLSHGVWPSSSLPDERRIALTIDPKVELSGIVHMLVGGPPAATDPSDKIVRTYFEQHRAAPLIVALTATPVATVAAVVPEVVPVATSVAAAPQAPEPAEPSSASVPQTLPQLLADFMRQTKFALFLRSRQATYKANAAQVSELAERAAIDWEIYSGVAVAPSKAVLSMTQPFAADICPALAPRATAIVRWSPELTSADVFTSAGMARSGLVPAPTLTRAKAKAFHAALEPVQDQLVAAVFVRIAALSRGEDAGAAQMRREIRNGHELVPQMVQSLRFFESHRGEFPTLALFLPRLLSSLPKQLRADGAAPTVKVPLCERAA